MDESSVPSFSFSVILSRMKLTINQLLAELRVNPSWAERLAEHLATEIQSIAAVSGGCINQSYRVELETRQCVFVKSKAQAGKVKAGTTDTMFTSEAQSLRLMNQCVPNCAPQVLAVEKDFLCLAWVEPKPPQPNDWFDAGVLLAKMHQTTSPRFGFEFDNYCGATQQRNGWADDGWVFFQQQRLLAQLAMAKQQQRLSSNMVSRIQRIGHQLSNVIPEAPAVLLHGDLWSGNLMFSIGGPKLIDPAAHFGWAEADLAMTLMFGAFPPAFYAGYESMADVPADWRERAAVYNLYHWLNHLNLFGESYLSALENCVAQCESLNNS